MAGVWMDDTIGLLVERDGNGAVVDMKEVPAQEMSGILSQQIGVYRALKLWHGKDRRQFAALAAWQVRGVLWNEVRRERDFRDHRCSECEGDGCEPGLEQAVVNDFYQQDERRTRILAVRVLLARLPKMQAIVVRALYLEGKEPRDVALEQHINVSSVYRRRDRGIANLHKLLTGGRRLA